MSELATVEPIAKPTRFGGTPLQQFARAGLALTIVDFRKMCSELSELGFNDCSPHDINDTLYDWLIRTSDI
jgi:hypothetical protein